MNILKKIFKFFLCLVKLFIIVFFLLFFIYFSLTKYFSCITPVTYSIGEIDSRFNINELETLKIISDAEKIWEKPMGLNLFEYDKNSSLKINFTYDKRQENFNNSQEIEKQLNENDILINTKNKKYNDLLQEYNEKKVLYNIQLNHYNNVGDEYEKKVLYWNNLGGAPENIYNELEIEFSNLNKLFENLKLQEEELLKFSTELNIVLEKNNSLIFQHNKKVNNFNKEFGEAKEFNQGNYTGSAINVFHFRELNDLKILLAHEFGHSLGLGHVETPKSLMYYLLNEQDIENFNLTEEDKDALVKECHINKYFYKIQGVYEKISPFVKNLDIFVSNFYIKILNLKEKYYGVDVGKF